MVVVVLLMNRAQARRSPQRCVFPKVGFTTKEAEMKNLGGTAAALVLLSGCVYHVGSTPDRDAKSAVVARPYDVVWERALQSMVRRGMKIRSQDAGAGVITTEAKPVELSEEEAYCGYANNSPRLIDPRCETALSYTVSLTREGAASTRVVVDAKVEGILAATADNEEKKLDCVSLGKRERAIVAEIGY
jgi:uncharacterized lipoprotein